MSNTSKARKAGMQSRLRSPFGDHMYHINLSNSNVEEEIKNEVDDDDDPSFCINSSSSMETETNHVKTVTNTSLPTNAKVTILNSTNAGTQPTIVVKPFQTFNKSGSSIKIAANKRAGTSSAASGTTTTSIPLSSLPLKAKRSVTPTISSTELPPLPKKQILMLPKNVGGLGNNRLVRWKVVGQGGLQNNSVSTLKTTTATSPVPQDAETTDSEPWNNMEAASVRTATTTAAAAETVTFSKKTKIFAAETRTVSLNEVAALTASSNKQSKRPLLRNEAAALSTKEEEEEEEESEKKVFTCFHCEFQTENPWEMRDHDEIHEEFFCDLCCVRFHSNIAMELHRKKHFVQTFPQIYHCLVQGCNKTFPSAHQMSQHKKIHSDAAKGYQYIVEMRNRRIEEDQRIEEERTITTVRITPHNCGVCQTYFDSEFDLKMHKRKHDRDLPFTCSHCAAKFNTVSLLKTHERTHSVFSDPTGTPSQSREDLPKTDFRWSTVGKEKLWMKDRLKVNRCRMCYMGFHDRKSLLNHVCVTQGDTVSVKEILDFQELQYGMD